MVMLWCDHINKYEILRAVFSAFVRCSYLVWVCGMSKKLATKKKKQTMFLSKNHVLGGVEEERWAFTAVFSFTTCWDSHEDNVHHCPYSSHDHSPVKGHTVRHCWAREHQIQTHSNSEIYIVRNVLLFSMCWAWTACCIRNTVCAFRTISKQPITQVSRWCDLYVLILALSCCCWHAENQTPTSNRFPTFQREASLHCGCIRVLNGCPP